MTIVDPNDPREGVFGQPQPVWSDDHAAHDAMDGAAAEQEDARRARVHKYAAMQALLVEIASCAPADNHAAHFGPRAKALLACMDTIPRTPYARTTASRANERASELEALAFAYRNIGNLHPSQPDVSQEAAAIALEALEAWEREHPP